jgi:hypothetical protein
MSEEKKHVEKPAVETADEKIKRLTLENLQAEKEAKALELEERKYHIQSLKSSIADRQLQDKQLEYDRQSKQKTFAQADATDQFNWKVCTHRKGGMASARDIRCLTRGGNDAGQYAVIKHQMINGDIWVRCQRCSRTWMPPVEKNFYMRNGVSVAPQDGVFDADLFKRAQRDYEEAVNFPTRNSMSGSVQCRFFKYDRETGKQIDGAEQYRENIASSNLR